MGVLNDNGVILLCLLVMGMVVLVGGFIGYDQQMPDLSRLKDLEHPGSFTAWDAFTFIGDGVSYFWDLMWFQAPDTPVFMSLLVWAPIAVLLLWVILKLIRGSSG